jgi:dTDP-4-dehydrorhamnose 3,5-epimerase
VSEPKLHPLPLAGLYRVTRSVIPDSRGTFSRVWSAKSLAEYGFPEGPLQVNHSTTFHCGTVRGLHYQRPPFVETRLVTCIRGKIFDVAVDLRPESPTYLRWHSEVLSADSGDALLIPEGFAHGYQTLTNDCEIVYCHSENYVAEAESGVAYNDPVLGISWPKPVTMISDRDRSHPQISDTFNIACARVQCRHCRGHLSHQLIDLGNQPSSNDYITLDRLSQRETILPLRVYVCDRCWLVQTEDHTSRESLFNHDYAYFSSTSFTWAKHAAAYTSMIVERLGLTREDFVLEIASNDGYLLRHFVALGIPCLGIEPTASTASAAEAVGVPTRREFFGEACGKSLAASGCRANLVIANNVFAHVPDINDFARGLSAVLSSDGTITLEFPSLRTLLEQTLFDTIYHEHFSYISLSVAERILRGAGLRVFDVEEYATHGGSLRVYACHSADSRSTSHRVREMLDAEDAAGLHDGSAYLGFQSRAEQIRDELVEFLNSERQAGRRVAAYGAAAKGNTLLNFAKVTTDMLPYVCDAAKSKQGLFLPGSKIPIMAPESLLGNPPDTVLILAWNLAGEIKHQLAPRLPTSTRFVVALPKLKDV